MGCCPVRIVICNGRHATVMHQMYLGSSRLARLISKCSLEIDLLLGVVYFQWSIPFMTRWEWQLRLFFQGCFFIRTWIQRA